MPEKFQNFFLSIIIFRDFSSTEKRTPSNLQNSKDLVNVIGRLSLIGQRFLQDGQNYFETLEYPRFRSQVQPYFLIVLRIIFNSYILLKNGQKCCFKVTRNQTFLKKTCFQIIKNHFVHFEQKSSIFDILKVFIPFPKKAGSVFTLTNEDQIENIQSISSFLVYSQYNGGPTNHCDLIMAPIITVLSRTIYITRRDCGERITQRGVAYGGDNLFIMKIKKRHYRNQVSCRK